MSYIRASWIVKESPSSWALECKIAFNQSGAIDSWTDKTYIVAIGVDASVDVICLKADKVPQLGGILPGINKYLPEFIWRSDLVHICYGRVCDSINWDLHQLAT